MKPNRLLDPATTETAGTPVAAPAPTPTPEPSPAPVAAAPVAAPAPAEPAPTPAPAPATPPTVAVPVTPVVPGTHVGHGNSPTHALVVSTGTEHLLAAIFQELQKLTAAAESKGKEVVAAVEAEVAKVEKAI